MDRFAFQRQLALTVSAWRAGHTALAELLDWAYEQGYEVGSPQRQPNRLRPAPYLNLWGEGARAVSLIPMASTGDRVRFHAAAGDAETVDGVYRVGRDLYIDAEHPNVTVAIKTALR